MILGKSFQVIKKKSHCTPHLKMKWRQLSVKCKIIKDRVTKYMFEPFKNRKPV